VAERTCPYCKGDLPDGAVKCRSCGEWVDARWRLAAAGKVCVALVAAELAVMAVMAARWLPALRTMFVELGSRLPAFTTLVLRSWWLPLWIAVLAGLCFVALGVVERMRLRVTMLATTMALGTIVIAATLWGAYAPIWELAAAIEP
jgi:hypothetical protein